MKRPHYSSFPGGPPPVQSPLHPGWSCLFHTEVPATRKRLDCRETERRISRFLPSGEAGCGFSFVSSLKPLETRETGDLGGGARFSSPLGFPRAQSGLKEKSWFKSSSRRNGLALRMPPHPQGEVVTQTLTSQTHFFLQVVGSGAGKGPPSHCGRTEALQAAHSVGVCWSVCTLLLLGN